VSYHAPFAGDDRSSVGRIMKPIARPVTGIALCHIAGPQQALTPSHEPICVQTKPFIVEGDGAQCPYKAIAEHARTLHGIEVHTPHFEMVACYAVTATNVRHSYVFFFRYLPERWLRQRAGMDEQTLDRAFAESWAYAKVPMNR
jgi:hypothetical protein